MIKAVLFDLDNTLIDHDGAIRSAASALFDNLMPIEEESRSQNSGAEPETLRLRSE